MHQLMETPKAKQAVGDGHKKLVGAIRFL